MQDASADTTHRSRLASGGFVTVGTLILASGSAAALALTSGCRTAPRANGQTPASASKPADKAAEARLRQAVVEARVQPFDEQFYVAPPQDADE